jgi:hypothetical protein
MISDMNKGISEIQNNHMNLPRKVVFDTDKYIEYTYDAAGTKLRKKVINGANTHTTDYIYGLHITEGSLDFVPTAEGRYMFADNSCQYNLTDHLACLPELFSTLSFKVIGKRRQGTVRAVVAHTKVDGNNVMPTTLADYYPFGLRMRAQYGGQRYRYGYQGEFAEDETDETGYNNFQLRMYACPEVQLIGKPVVGRWFSTYTYRKH